MFKVTQFTVRKDGVNYGPEHPEDEIEGLTKAEERRLESKGYGRILNDVEYVSKSPVQSPLKQKNDIPIPQELNVEEVETLISETDDPDSLYKMLEFEEKTKGRKGVIEPLEDKLSELG